RTMHIGIDHIVDRLSPFAHGLLQFVRRARPQQLVDTVSPRRSAACTGVAEGQACAVARVASDNRPMVCSDDIEILRCCTTRAELFVRYLSWEPGVFIGILERAILRAKTLDKQVLIISIAMCHAPGHVLSMAEVRCPGHAGYGVATDAERWARHVELILHVRGIEG